MPVFILMTKLSDSALRDSESRRAMGRLWLEKVERSCPGVRWISHYAIFGPYDFMDIFDAPDVGTAQRVALISRAEGAVSAESWHALPYDEFLDVLDEIE